MFNRRNENRKVEVYQKLPLFLAFFSSFYFSSFLVNAENLHPVPVALQKSDSEVTGTVVDSKGEPIIGASVRVVGSAMGSITDFNGIFHLKIPVGSKISISYVGYQTKTLTVDGSKLNVTLQENEKMLGEVQVVAYGVQKKVTVTGAISSLKGDDLLKTSTGSVANVLSGQVTGLSSIQYSGEPGADAASLLVRGKATFNDASPLVQVDGVEREDGLTSIDPNEVESITILKDASATAVFGIRGANGVILITTKRGKEGKAKISVSTSFSVLSPTKMVEQANSYQYATFYNAMRKNDGQTELFPQEVINKFKDHSDPIRFPDVRWTDYVMKKTTLQSQHNVNISGGTSKVRYFISAGIYTQDGLFKEFNLPYDVSFQYKRFNYRSNFDINITKTTVLSFNLGGNVNSQNRPKTGQGSSGLIKKLYYATPFSSPGIVNGRYVKTDTNYDGVNLPFTGSDGMDYYNGGFTKDNNNVLNADLILNQKLDFLTKGLSFKIKGSYNSSFSVSKTGDATIAYYTPILHQDGSMGFRKYGETSDIKYETPDYGKARDWYMEASFNYARSFGGHNITALLLYNQSKEYYLSMDSRYTDIPRGYVGLVGRITYDWKNKYLAEFNVGYNGSENFAPEHRFGTFPAGSLGYVISEEKFWEPLKNIINFFKVRATWGLVGNDKYSGQRFMYLSDPYNANGSSYIFGTGTPSSSLGAYEAGKSNPNVGWETSFKQNYGVDLTMFNNRLNASFDYYMENRKNILVKDGTLPGIIGFTIPVTNVGKVNSWGWELSLKWNDKIGQDFRYWIGLNLSYNQNKVIDMREAPKNNAYELVKGHRIGSRSQYKFWRYYDEGTPELYEKTFGKPFPKSLASDGLQPGDAVYVDLDGNGIIDSDDMSRDYGFTDDPEYMGGINLGFNWKGWEMSMQWTGAWNVSRMLSDVFQRPFYSSSDAEKGGLLVYHLEHTWTADNPSQDAEYPRASWAHANNNYATSTLYEKDAKYLRLKTLQLAYNFNFPFMKKLKMTMFQLSFSGYNLLTLTPYLWGDPEARASSAPSYPLARTYTLGLKLGF